METNKQTISNGAEKTSKNPLARTATEKVKKTRRLTGTVTSAKMLKTVVVTVNRLKTNKKYKKQYLVSKKYKAHDEKGEYKAGDRVIIREIRPLSKDKNWIVAGKVKVMDKKI
jgi:small subunit ribosomal protein S17